MNRLIGARLDRDYIAMWLYPLGIEIFSLETEVSFVITLHPIELSVSFQMNHTLFRND